MFSMQFGPSLWQQTARDTINIRSRQRVNTSITPVYETIICTTAVLMFRGSTQWMLPRLHQPLLPRPIPGLTSSSSGWQWFLLCCRSWQRCRLFTKPFLSGFSPFFTRWHTSPSAGLVAGLSVIAGRRLWTRDGNLHVGTRSSPAVQSGDSIRAGDDQRRTTNSLAPSLAHATRTHIRHAHTHTGTHSHTLHTQGETRKSRH